MGDVQYTWMGEQAAQHMGAAFTAGLEALGRFLAEAERAAIAVQGPPPSSPGEAPHKEVGDLQDSIGYQVGPEGNTLWVGSSLDVLQWLELGTATMAARPSLGPTILENAGAGAKVFEAAAKGAK